jgi:hypothetical protein
MTFGRALKLVTHTHRSAATRYAPRKKAQHARFRQKNRLPLVISGLALVLATQFFLSSTLVREDRSWFLEVDDHEAFLFSREVASHGVPVLTRVAPIQTDFPVFDPRGTVGNGDQLTSARGFGAFYVLGAGHIFGPEGVFFVPIAFGLLSTIGIFLLGNEKWGVGAGLGGAAAFGLSGPAIFWAATLFSSILALPFGIFGAYLLARFGRFPSILLASGSAALFSLAGMIRAEYWLFGLVLWAGFMLSNRNLRKPATWAAVAATAGAMAAAFVFISYLMYGQVDPLKQLTAGEGTQASAADEPQTGGIPSIFQSISPPRILETILKYGFEISPVMLALAVPLFGRARADRLPILSLATLALVIILIFGGNSFGTGSGIPLFSSYVRFFLPLLAIAAVAFGACFTASVRNIGTALGVAGLVFGVIAGPAMAVYSPEDGINAAGRRMEEFRSVAKEAESLPPNAIIVGDTISRIVISRTVLSPLAIPSEAREPELLRLSGRLHDAGYPIYVSRYSHDDIGGRYWDIYQSQPGITLEKVESPHFRQVNMSRWAG